MRGTSAFRRVRVRTAQARVRRATTWNEARRRCSHCGHPSDAEPDGGADSVAWCRRCRQVFTVPSLKVPDWVTGVLAILAINIGLL